MFFGKGNKAEEVPLGEVASLVEGLFNKKIAGMEAKASRMLSRIEDSKRLFIDACDRFDSLSTEPDLEDLYFASASHIKSQKGTYISALKRIASSESGSDSSKGAYYMYERRLINAEAMLSEILKINGTFRTVIYAYSKDLERFKQSFASMENATKELRTEIDFRAVDVNEYKAIISAADELVALLEENAALGNEEAILSSDSPDKAKGVSEDEKRSAAAAIKSKEQEISSLTSKISDTHSMITNLLNAIDKAARKHDYGSFSKTKISSYIEDPDKMLIRSSVGYADFYSQIQSLSKDVLTDRLGLKNKEEVMKSVNAILSGKIAEYIEQINSLNMQLEPYRRELRDLEMIEKELRIIESSSISKEAKLSEVRKRISEIKASLDPKKRALESKIDYAYKKKIVITLLS